MMPGMPVISIAFQGLYDAEILRDMGYNPDLV